MSLVKLLGGIAASAILVVVISFAGDAVYGVAGSSAPPAKAEPNVAEAPAAPAETAPAEVAAVEPAPAEPAAAEPAAEAAPVEAAPAETAVTEAPAATIPAEDTAPDAVAETAAPAEAVVAVAAGAGDAEAGQAVSRKCVACHSFDKGGKNKVGPAMFGIVDRDIANAEGFKYSDALLALDGTWTVEKLDAWIADPKGFVAGNKMTFAGIKNEKDRQNLLAYLQTLK